MTDYERGRLAGYAEGVEAAREAAQMAIRVWATGTGTRVHEVVDGAIRALLPSAPGPAPEEPGAREVGMGEPFCACGRRHSDCDGSRKGCRAPSPKEDAPR